MNVGQLSSSAVIPSEAEGSEIPPLRYASVGMTGRGKGGGQNDQYFQDTMRSEGFFEKRTIEFYRIIEK